MTKELTRSDSAAKAASNIANGGLTPSQERAIEALLTSRSVPAAARQAEVGKTSLRRWLREDGNLQNKLHGLRQETLSHATLQLQQGACEAAGVLREVVKGEKRIEPARASLIRAAVDFGFRSSVYDDVVGRLKTVEKNQREALKQ